MEDKGKRLTVNTEALEEQEEACETQERWVQEASERVEEKERSCNKKPKDLEDAAQELSQQERDASQREGYLSRNEHAAFEREHTLSAREQTCVDRKGTDAQRCWELANHEESCKLLEQELAEAVTTHRAGTGAAGHWRNRGRECADQGIHGEGKGVHQAQGGCIAEGC